MLLFFFIDIELEVFAQHLFNIFFFHFFHQSELEQFILVITTNEEKEAKSSITKHMFRFDSKLFNQTKVETNK